MSEIEELVESVEAEMEAFEQVLDKYEQTREQVDGTLADSTLDNTGSAVRRRPEQVAETQPSNAD